MGPYFVVGAVFSGVALLFILLVVTRSAFKLADYIGTAQYGNLGIILLVMSIVWFYFTYTEHLVQVAGQKKDEFAVLASKLWGPDAPAFWVMVILMVIAAWILIVPRLVPDKWGSLMIFRPRTAMLSAIATLIALALVVINQISPATIFVGEGTTIGPYSRERVLVLTFLVLLGLTGITSLIWLKRHQVAGTTFASLCIVLGMWLERWNIIVPTLNHPYLVEWADYVPTVTEWVLVIASYALFALMFLIILKIVPPVSVWEVSEGRVVEQAKSKIEIPMPEPSLTDWERRRSSWMKRFTGGS